jgi:hypothetical protein
MLQATQSPHPPRARRAPERPTVRAVRPALIDLRFTGDAWLLDNRDGTATLCLGAYRMLNVQTTPLDLPGLNRAFFSLRLGQARKQATQRS